MALSSQTLKKAYDKAMRRRVRAQTPKDAITRVNADSAGAPAGEVCAVMTASVQAMLDLPEPYKSWQLTGFVQSMQ